MRFSRTFSDRSPSWYLGPAHEYSRGFLFALEQQGTEKRLVLMRRDDAREASDLALLAGIFLLFMLLVTVVAFILS